MNKSILRIVIICIAVLVFYLIIEARLWEEQILHGSHYDKAVSSQSIRRIRKPSPRGRIFTADKKLLADNIPVFNVIFHLREMRQPGRKKATIQYIVNAAEKTAEIIGRENTLKFDVLFILPKTIKGDESETAKTVMMKINRIALKGKIKNSLSRGKIIEHLIKRPQQALTVFENLNQNECEKIKHIIPKIKGAFLTEENIIHHINTQPALPMTVFENLTTQELAKISEIPSPIPGMEIVTVPQRRYKHGSTACHLLGYIRKGNPKEAQDRDEYFYYIPDEKGKKGIEKIYDSSIPEVDIQRRGLRGTPGSSLVRVDFRGFIYKSIGNSILAQPGNDIVLTINLKAQQIAEKLMLKHNGAFVLLDANTGAVLTMVSSPGYDVSKFMPKLSSKYWNKLQKDPKRPLFNRATSGEYEPGSIIKPVIALSILENNISASEMISCPGRSYIGDATIRCGRRNGHGSLNLVSALEQSCNVFFIEHGRILGLEKLAETLASLGIGKKTEFALYERSGLLPSRGDLYYKTGRKWNVFDTALISIGQGNIHVTPLQAALFTAAIANGGTLWRPYLLQQVLDPKGNTIYINTPFPRAELKINKDYLDIIHQGMYKVVHGRHGSGKQANSKKIQLHGKTGTAEKGSGENKSKNTWFTGFGTHKGKTYAFTVFVENGKSGGKTCAPIARQFFDTWLE